MLRRGSYEIVYDNGKDAGGCKYSGQRIEGDVYMVSVKLCEGLFGKVSVMHADTKEILWEGKSGQKAEFEVAEDTPVWFIWGILQTPNLNETVKKDGNYELIFRMKPFKSEYSLIDLDEPYEEV